VDNTTGAAIVFATFTATATYSSMVRKFEIVGTWSGTATVGTQVPPFTLLVKDQNDAPVPNYTFTLRSMTAHLMNGAYCTSSPGDDQLVNPTLTTGPDGTVTFSGWTVSTQRGPKCIGVFPGTAQPQNLDDVGSWQIWLTALAGPATQLVKKSQDNQQAPAGTKLTVGIMVADQYGNAIGCSNSSIGCDPNTSEATVTFAPSAGGQVDATQATTQGGMAYAYWTLESGANTLTITVGSLTATYTATGT
jgi:hypothetical protein